MWHHTLMHVYPGAIPFTELTEKTARALAQRGYHRDNTLFSNVTCRDEINHAAIDQLAATWGERFNLAGLGGFPTAGRSGFGAYAAHLPKGGALFMFYGPHEGVNAAGKLGRVLREGMSEETPACGALLGYLAKLEKQPDYQPQPDDLDIEQQALERELHPRREEILAGEDHVAAITERALSVIEEQLWRIIEESGYFGPLILLGGIHLNTPTGEEDWFHPRRADLLLREGDQWVTESWREMFL